MIYIISTWVIQFYFKVKLNDVIVFPDFDVIMTIMDTYSHIAPIFTYSFFLALSSCFGVVIALILMAATFFLIKRDAAPVEINDVPSNYRLVNKVIKCV